MKLNTQKQGDITIIKLEGRLDVHLSLEIEQDVNALIDAGNKKLLFDLGGVEYLSSSGLRIFIAAMRRLKNEGGALKLCHMSESVRKIFTVVELYDLFEVFNDSTQALASFS